MSAATVASWALLVGLLALGSSPVHGFVPFDLANFQNEYACDNSSVRIVRPVTVEDVAAAVRFHSTVKAVGGGWSWNQPFFCASNGSAPPNPNGFVYGTNGSALAGAPPPPANGTANIVMGTLRPLMIEVDEQGQSVTVDAGVRTIDLLRYLADYVTPTSPSGYTLPAFPWFVFQTLGGAVSTGTHGSSLQHHSLSSQVLELTVVLANGTVRTFSDETDPFLMRALRVSVGQLGIIVRIKFRIVPELPVTRTLHRIAASEYLALLRAAQDRWNANETLPAWMDETEWFWVPQRHEFLMVSYVRGDSANATERLAVLSAYASAPPESTTAYNTSLELLQQAANAPGGPNVSVSVWPLLSNVTFDPATNLSTVALPVLRRLNESVINKPWQQEGALNAAPSSSGPLPTADSSNSSSASTAATSSSASGAGGGGAVPAVKALAGPADAPAAAVGGGGAPAAAATPPLRRKGGPQLPAAQAANQTTNQSNGQVVALFKAVASRVLADGGGAAEQQPSVAAVGSDWAIAPSKPPSVFYGLVNMADPYIDISRSGVFAIAANTTREALQGYLYQPEAILDVNIRKVTFDQYEVAMPVASMADCWQGLLELLYGADNLDGRAYNGTVSPLSLLASLAPPNNTRAGSMAPSAVIAANGRPDYGFRSNPLIRSTGREAALLSNTEDGPRLWLNIEDYLYHNRPVRRTNTVFKRLVGYLRSDPRCGPTGIGGGGARLHWGKAGWPDAGCWHGDKEFPDTWCDFGCAVRQLDPTGKFRDSAPDRWNWEGAPLEQCCGPEGFRRADPACVCRVTHSRSAATCPPPPYYTYR